ncbi:sensor histidine kinase [Roseospirillum parvum]|nr:ATP-binding protein [Roseospirillum parvum]
MWHRHSLWDFAMLAAAVGLPAGLGLGLLVALGRLDPLPAILTMAGVMALTAALILPRFRDLERISRFAADLSDRGDLPVPVPRHSRAAAELAQSIARLRRSWETQSGQLKSLALSHETVLDSLPDPLIMVDPGGVVRRANLAARLVLGRVLENQEVTQVFRDPLVLEAVEAVLAGAGGREVPYVVPVPVRRDFTLRVEPLPTATAEGAVAMLMLHDITTLVRMEQMRADFVANASHELRTPLSSLLGFIETLRGPAHDDAEARDRFLIIMQEQAQRMNRLIEDLLSLSRIELMEHTPPTGAVRLERVVSAVVGALEPQARAQGVTVETALPDDLPAVIGEREELAQVIQNLLANAIKYGVPAGASAGRVEITAGTLRRGPVAMPQATRADCVFVAVRDHGDGIPKEHLPRLTERFYRVDSARSRQLGGTGLGLAIVKHILNRHRAAMVVDSQVGGGTTFTVYLPRAASGQQLDDDPPGPSPRPARGNPAAA